MNGLIDRISREPVLAFGAIGLSITAWAPSFVNTDAKKAALAAIVLWFQRTFTTSRKTADENVETAKYVGAVEHQAVTTAAQLIANSQSEPLPPAPATAPPPPPAPQASEATRAERPLTKARPT